MDGNGEVSPIFHGAMMLFFVIQLIANHESWMFHILGESSEDLYVVNNHGDRGIVP